MVKMVDVARRAGVSVSTVSHVINGTRYVKDETIQLVRQAIHDTGYTHNTIARSLVTQSTQTIGLAISTISNVYFADLVGAMESAARRAGYTLLLADSHDDADEELRAVSALHQRRVDGVLFAPVTGPDGAALGYLEELGVPTVLVDRCPSDHFDQVGVENVEATAGLVEHLVSIGHSRIGMVAGLPGLSTSSERVAGYRLALERCGVPYDEKLVADGHSNAVSAEAATRELLRSPDPPTALVSANNHMTIGVMRALDLLGVRVPADLGLVVFDDFEWAALFHPRLTAVAQPIREIGDEAVRMLIDRIRDPRRPPRTQRLATTFNHRDSCGCPPP
jgi:LacI family transcriptional regulator